MLDDSFTLITILLISNSSNAKFLYSSCFMTWAINFFSTLFFYDMMDIGPNSLYNHLWNKGVFSLYFFLHAPKIWIVMEKRLTLVEKPDVKKLHAINHISYVYHCHTIELVLVFPPQLPHQKYNLFLPWQYI